MLKIGFIEIKGADNPTCQLLPIITKQDVKMRWERQERERAWAGRMVGKSSK